MLSGAFSSLLGSPKASWSREQFTCLGLGYPSSNLEPGLSRVFEGECLGAAS